jgi:hypothetical protein
MFSLIKYEFKSIYKDLIGILVSILIMFILVSTKMNFLFFSVNDAVIMALTIAVIVITIIDCIKVFGKYLYSDDGYLMFTLPQSGYSIVGSRLIVSLILVFLVSMALYGFIYYGVFVRTLKMSGLSNLFDFKIPAGAIDLSILDWTIKVAASLCIVYFSMVLGKSIIPIKKHEKLIAFITFIVISVILGKFNDVITSNLAININYNIQGHFNFGAFINGDIQNNITTINLVGLILNLIEGAGFFCGTAYLIDNKLEL